MRFFRRVVDVATVKSPDPNSVEPLIVLMLVPDTRVACAPRLVLAVEASEAPVPPSATAKSVEPGPTN